MPEVSAIVLAAGLSTRMGGPNKLLLPWNGTTVVGAVVGALRQCEVEIIVVTGRDSDEVAQAVGSVRTVFNESYEQGMGTSITVGVKACPPENAIIIVLGDMPELDSSIVEEMLNQLGTSSDIVVPVYSDEPNRPGHPVLFGSDYRQELISLKEDSGAKQIIIQNEQSVTRIDISGSLRDINSANDLDA